MYQDKTLVCRDCGQEFIFSAGEQEFFATEGAAERARPLPELPHGTPHLGWYGWRRAVGRRSRDDDGHLLVLRPAGAGAVRAAQ